MTHLLSEIFGAFTHIGLQTLEAFSILFLIVKTATDYFYDLREQNDERKTNRIKREHRKARKIALKGISHDRRTEQARKVASRKVSK